MAPSETRPRSLVVVRPTLGPGGADRVTVTLLESLDRDRVSPSLVLFRREGPYLDDLPEDVPLETLGASSLWTAWWPLARYLARQQPDVLFSTCSGTNVTACLASILSGRRARLVLSERNVLMRDQPLVKKWLMLFAKNLLYPVADRITVVSRGVANDLLDKLFLDSDKLEVVYNPIVGPDVEAMASEALKDPPFDLHVPVVLAAGRLVPAKGFDVLLAAFASVAAQTEAHLVILGDGPLRSELEAQARGHGIAGRVHMPGFVKNPFRYMARSTVFVLSSRFEGLPGVLLQAMACGVPVISTDCPAGPDEILTDGRDGVLVPVNSAEAIAGELLTLLRDPERRSRLASAGRERSQAFRTEPVVREYLRVLVGETAS
ncbi:MAG: glycosyltransferase [Thermoanaerobaculia bacterium]